MTIPDGKTIATDGGGLARQCPECGELVALELVISDVYEIADERGNAWTAYVPEGAKPPSGTAVSARGQHTDYDDAAYREHYEGEHAAR